MFYNIPNIRTMIGRAVRNNTPNLPTRLMITACCNHKRSPWRPQLHNKDIIVSNLQMMPMYVNVDATDRGSRTGLSLLKRYRCFNLEGTHSFNAYFTYDSQRKLPTRPNWGSRDSDSGNRGVWSQQQSVSISQIAKDGSNQEEQADNYYQYPEL